MNVNSKSTTLVALGRIHIRLRSPPGPRSQLSPAEAAASELVCAVCTCAVAEGEELATLPCGHQCAAGRACRVVEGFFAAGYAQNLQVGARCRYHADCILPWLRNSACCPICRAELESDEAKYERGTPQGWENTGTWETCSADVAIHHWCSPHLEEHYQRSFSTAESVRRG